MPSACGDGLEATDNARAAPSANDVGKLSSGSFVQLGLSSGDGLLHNFRIESSDHTGVNYVLIVPKKAGLKLHYDGAQVKFADDAGNELNKGSAKNSLDVINGTTMKVLHNYPLSPCGGPTGLALDKQHQRLFTGCRENKGMSVVDINTGKVITTLPIGGGVDAVVYDASTNLIFCSNGDSTTTIIKQKSADEYAVVQTLYTRVRAKTVCNFSSF